MYLINSYMLFDNLPKGAKFYANSKCEIILIKTDEDLCRDVKTGEVYHVPNGDSWLIQEVLGVNRDEN